MEQKKPRKHFNSNYKGENLLLAHSLCRNSIFASEQAEITYDHLQDRKMSQNSEEKVGSQSDESEAEDLAELWNQAIELKKEEEEEMEDQEKKNQSQGIEVVKVERQGNGINQDENEENLELTEEQMKIFMECSNSKKEEEKVVINIVDNNDDCEEDLSDLWNKVVDEQKNQKTEENEENKKTNEENQENKKGNQEEEQSEIQLQKAAEKQNSAKEKIEYEIKNEECSYSTILVHGKDYNIYNTKKFLLSPFREKTHSYFGISYLTDEENSQALYLPATGQKILEVVEHDQYSEVFYLVLSHNKEKIAIVQKEWVKKKRAEHMEVKIYDEYEEKVGETVALIETQDGYYSQHCFCNSSIWVMVGKGDRREKRKYEMNLKLINNKIVANLGISQVQSSVINCILYDKTESNSFMLGTMTQEGEQVHCIMKNGGGLSPITSFVAFLSRKKYNQSYGL